MIREIPVSKNCPDGGYNVHCDDCGTRIDVVTTRLYKELVANKSLYAGTVLCWRCFERKKGCAHEYI